jgi:hypothetical protein
VISGYVLEPDLVMEPDYVAGKVHEIIRLAGVPAWNVHAVNARHATGNRDAIDFPDHVFIVLEKFIIVPAV